MASTTTNLGLTKPAYSDDADISDINGNMDLIDAEAGKVRANVAANYDSSETYAVGDYCLHDGSLYKCSTAISSPEAWTAGHWTQIKITGELSALNGNLVKVDLTSQCTWNSNITFYSKRLTKLTNHMAILQLSCGTNNMGANTEIVTLPMTVDMFYAPAITTEGGLKPVNGAVIFRSASQDKKILSYVDNPGAVFIANVVLTF